MLVLAFPFFSLPSYAPPLTHGRGLDLGLYAPLDFDAIIVDVVVCEPGGTHVNPEGVAIDRVHAELEEQMIQTFTLAERPFRDGVTCGLCVLQYQRPVFPARRFTL